MATAGVSASLFMGCTPKTPDTSGTPTPTPDPTPAPSGGTGSKAIVPLNPQTDDFHQNSGKMDKIFSEWKLGNLTMKNRIVKSAAGSRTTGDPVSFKEYYRRFAADGAAMVWIEDCCEKFEGFSSGRPPMASIPFEETAKAIHAEGSNVGYQLSALGYRFSGTPAGGNVYDASKASWLTHDEVVGLIAEHGAAAKRFKEIGYDAVEINSAGNNLGVSFLSRSRNDRDDEYGGQSMENRTRFLVECIKAIKKECGQDFPVQILMNAIEENDNVVGDSYLASSMAECKYIAKTLVDAGADSIHLRLGPLIMHEAQFAGDLYFDLQGLEGSTGLGTQYDFTKHFDGKVIANRHGCCMMFDIAKEYQDVVDVPIGTVTYIDPAQALDIVEEGLESGAVDFLMMNRPLTVDPQYITKLKAGRFDEIAPCCRCMSCHSNRSDPRNEHCRVNATTRLAYGAEMPEGYEPIPASTPKKVMVVGAGPAGMEAARVAAQRGHKVTLYEKKGSVGGLIEFAHLVKGPHQNLMKWLDWHKKQLELAGVEVKTSTEVTADLIKSENPDAIIFACGGKRDSLGMASTAGTKVVPISDFMSADLGERVVVLGCNAQAVDVASYLIAQGKQVELVFPDAKAKVGKGQSQQMLSFNLPILYAKGMRAWPNAKVKSVGDGVVTIVGIAGIDIPLKADSVIESMDMLPNKDLANGLEGKEVYFAGDCNEPYSMSHATIAGNLAARAV